MLSKIVHNMALRYFNKDAQKFHSNKCFQENTTLKKLMVLNLLIYLIINYYYDEDKAVHEQFIMIITLMIF